MICKKCNQPQIKFGLYSCKSCRDLYHLNWRTQNRDHLNNWSNAWVAKNKEKRKEIIKRSESKDRIAHLAKRRKLYAEGRRRKDYKPSPDIRLRLKNKRRARLAQVIHEPYSAVKIFERDGFECRYCGKEATCLDHVHPISRGGADAEWNLNSSCRPCNTSKGSKTLEEWIEMRLG